MKRTMRQVVRMTGLALGLASCSAFGGGNATYYKAAIGQTSDSTGTDCPGVPDPVITLTGVDLDGTIAVYSEPNNQYLLDIGTGEGLTGTLTSGVYTFAGTEIDDIKGNPETINTTKITITLTPTGPGFTGTETRETICTSGNGTSCGSGDGKDFDCVVQAPVLGTQISGVEQQAPETPSTPNN